MMFEFLEARRARVAEAFVEAGAGDAVVLIGAGEVIAVPGGLDRVYPFHAHPHYYWLAEQECAGAVLCWDAEGGWRHFAPAVTDEQRVWDGDVSVDGEPLDELGGWLAARRGRAVAMLGVPVAGVRGGAACTRALDEALLHARRVKDSVEIERIKRSAEVTAAGHAAASAMVSRGGGVTERAIAVEIECAFRRGGADGTGYNSIVGSGLNAAIFHSTPGGRVVGDGETVLVDAGAEMERYTADVTRVYPGAGGFSGLQRELVSMVTEVERSGVAGCRAGVEFLDLHRAATVGILEGLRGMGVVRGDAEELAERGVGGMFFPHGLGHLVGLGVRDATGAQPGRAHRVGVGGVRVRLDARLDVGWVVTVEPGCYFVAGLLDDPRNQDQFGDAVDFGLTETIRKEIAGVRIEDDVLVTEGGCEVLTTGVPHFDE